MCRPRRTGRRGRPCGRGEGDRPRSRDSKYGRITVRRSSCPMCRPSLRRGIRGLRSRPRLAIVSAGCRPTDERPLTVLSLLRGAAAWPWTKFLPCMMTKNQIRGRLDLIESNFFLKNVSNPLTRRVPFYTFFKILAWLGTVHPRPLRRSWM